MTRDEPSANKRPATAAPTGNFNTRKESLWSAGGPNARNNLPSGSGMKYGVGDNNDLDDLDDDDEDGLGSGLEKRLSANKASSHQRSNDELLEQRRKLFGGGGANGNKTSSASGLKPFGSSN